MGLAYLWPQIYLLGVTASYRGANRRDAMTIQTATETQIATIRARRVDDTARAMMAEGVMLTHEQADDLGDEAMGWITRRLGLRVTETDRGVECTVEVAS